MKTIYKKPALYIIAIVLFLFSLSCSDVLEEDPKTVFTTAYFQTADGIQDALNAVYADMRYFYLPNGTSGLFNIGTDEWTYGEQPRVSSSGDNFEHRQLCNYNLTPSAGSLSGLWNYSFPLINQCNAVIKYAPEVSELTDEAKINIIAQAKFFRAFVYYNLVMQYGAVPTDLGEGDTTLNTKAFQGFNRLPLDQLLVKDYNIMITDFTYASRNLPDERDPVNFKATKAAALHMLSKMYLFRHYSDAKQTNDADSAYTIAKRLIDNQSFYGVALQQDFGDVHKQGNDYNTEILYSVDRIPGDNAQINEVNSPQTDFTYKVNMAGNNFTPNYEQNGLIDGRVIKYQRPLRKIAPTKWLLDSCFTDKTNDSRYHKTFRTVYLCLSVNAPDSPVANDEAYQSYLEELADLGLEYGDTAYYMPDTQAEADELNAQGVLYTVLGPDDWYDNQEDTVTIMHPALIKFIDSLRIHPYEVSQRAYPVIRLAETYLNAAEAAMILGDDQEAADLINVLKRRAAYMNNIDETEIENRYNNIAVTSNDIDLNFILDERARELCGESLRWNDLAGRKVLYERAMAHNPDVVYHSKRNSNGGLDRDATGTKYLVRPIPQSQLDAIDDPNREDYQNPGY